MSVRRPGRWLRRSAGGPVVAFFLLLLTGVAAALSYYPAGPGGSLGISRPTIQQQFVLTPGETISRASMTLDGTRVIPAWDATGLVTFTPAAPLAPGRHTVRLTVEIATGTAGWFYDPVVSEFAFTVTPDAQATLPPPDPEELRALERVNGYRQAGGVAPLTYSENLGAASRAHARYLMANPDVRDGDPHAERPGTPLFLGATAGDRAAHFGYIHGTDEVINFTDRAEVAVEGWMDTLYHRIPLIHPGSRTMGYGVAGAGVQLVNVLLTGPHDETYGAVTWPYPGQSGVPTGWDGAEAPDPFRLYPDAHKPAGYTVTLTFGGAPAGLVLRSGTLTGPDGEVPVLRYDPAIDPHLSDTVALIPRDPLQPGTTYTVAISGEVNLGSGPAPFAKRWSFTTASEHRPLLKRRVSVAAADGTIRRVTVDGSGFSQGLKVFLDGWPVADLTVESESTLSFRLPVGYTGGPSDLLVVTPAGWEAVWPGFFGTADWVRVRDGGPAFTEVPLLVQGKPWEAPALIHGSGAMLLPGDLLAAFGGKEARVPAVGRTYWALPGRSLDYTLGRTAAQLDGAPVTMPLPARRRGGLVYVDADLLARATGMGLEPGQAGVQFGLLDLAGHWARPQILRLVDAGIVTGNGGGKFRPDEPLSRAAFVKMLAGARSVPLLPGGSGGFSDTASHWVARQGYIGAAARAGIVMPREYPGGRFEPDRPITREEMAVMVTRALGLEAQAAARKLAPVGGTVALSGKLFADATAWTRPGHIAVAVEQGIIAGYGEPDGTFTYRPARLATRAEAAVMVVRTLDR